MRFFFSFSMVNDAVYVRYNNPTGAFLTTAGTEYETFMVVTKI